MGGMSQYTADLLRAIRENPDKVGLGWLLRPGTVTGASDLTAVSVRIDGPDGAAGDAIPVTPLGVSPAAGARVFVLSTPDGGNYALGGYTASTALCGVFSGTPDPSGYITLTHNAGYVPTVLMVQPISPITGTIFGQTVVDSLTVTDGRVRCISTTGAPMTIPVMCSWVAFP